MAGIGKQSQKPYNIDFQTVYVHTIGKDGKADLYPTKTEIIVDKGGDGLPAAYAPGEYTLHPSSVYIDRSGNLAIAPRLLKVAKPA